MLGATLCHPVQGSRAGPQARGLALRFVGCQVSQSSGIILRLRNADGWVTISSMTRFPSGVPAHLLLMRAAVKPCRRQSGHCIRSCASARTGMVKPTRPNPMQQAVGNLSRSAFSLQPSAWYAAWQVGRRRYDLCQREATCASLPSGVARSVRRPVGGWPVTPEGAVAWAGRNGGGYRDDGSHTCSEACACQLPLPLPVSFAYLCLAWHGPGLQPRPVLLGLRAKQQSLLRVCPHGMACSIPAQLLTTVARPRRPAPCANGKCNGRPRSLYCCLRGDADMPWCISRCVHIQAGACHK